MRHAWLAIASTLLAGGWHAAAQGHRATSLHDNRQIAVLTWNLYMGADEQNVLEADFSDPVSVGTAVADFLSAVIATDFPSRAEAIADEIAALEPDLVGLQEVSLLRLQSPGDYLEGNTQPAQEVLYDYLEILLDALATRGQDYEVAATIEEADIELPMLVGIEGGVAQFDDARLTDRDVILRRADISTGEEEAAHYRAQAALTLDGTSLEFTRGYVAVDATVGGQTYRFVNTHLEVAQDAATTVIQTAQALELLALLHDEGLPVILAGDFNAAPEGTETPVYGLIRAAGYLDVWTRQASPGPGYTCCQAADLRNDSSLLSTRIDLLWVRNRPGVRPYPLVSVQEVSVVGDEPADRTPSGLWPSDHAGVNARLRMP